MRIRWGKIIIGLLDIVIAVYLVLAVTSFNTPKEDLKTCTKVDINIVDEHHVGFLNQGEIVKLLKEHGSFPEGKSMASINPREIEDLLTESGPFVKTAQCYKTKNGHVQISITQRMPVIRIMDQRGNDYYLDDKGSPLPNSQYTSDMLIASGNISKWYAQNCLAPLSNYIMENDFWKNQIEQIHVLPDRGVELVPRVGDHVIFIGYLPQTGTKKQRNEKILAFAQKKLERMEKFYRYGLSKAGWNKYSYISVEFDNQIICKRKS